MDPQGVTSAEPSGDDLGGKGAASEGAHRDIRLRGGLLCKGPPNGAGPAFQNREKYLLPFLSLQIMDFLLCLLTLLGSYIELPAYLKFASRSSRAVSTQPGEAGGAQASGEGASQGPPYLVTFSKSLSPSTSRHVSSSVRCVYDCISGALKMRCT